MKALLPCLLSAAFAATGLAEDIKFPELTTVDGKTYKAVTVRKVEPDGLSIVHETGMAKVPFEKLPADLREKYGFDPDSAVEHRDRVAEAQRLQEAAQRVAREKQRAAAQEAAAAASDKDFAAKVQKAAKMMKVVAHQNADVGLIGGIREGTLSSEPVKNQLGNTVGRKPKWVYKTLANDGVITKAKGAQVMATDLGNEIVWEGKAWRIGLIQYRTRQGLIRTCPLYTASEKEAAGFYKRNGFSPKSDTIARKAD